MLQFVAVAVAAAHEEEEEEKEEVVAGAEVAAAAKEVVAAMVAESGNNVSAAPVEHRVLMAIDWQHLMLHHHRVAVLQHAFGTIRSASASRQQHHL